MERVDPQVLAKHWRWQKDKDGLVWLTFDKQGESTNTFSRQALEELRGGTFTICAERERRSRPCLRVILQDRGVPSRLRRGGAVARARMVRTPAGGS